MRDLVITVFSGPLAMALTCALGMACGYELPFVVACIVIAVVAIALGVGLAKIVETTTALLAVVMATITGCASAYGYRALHDMDTGSFGRDVAFADLASALDEDRITLRDGEPREDLFGLAVKKTSYGSGSTRYTQTSTCTAYPIVAASWKRSDAVQVWRFGDGDEVQGKPIGERVFHPSQPDELCRQAINDAIASRQLTAAAHPVYLEAMVSDSADADANRMKGWVSVAFLGGLWLVGALFTSAREAFADWR